MSHGSRDEELDHGARNSSCPPLNCGAGAALARGRSSHQQRERQSRLRDPRDDGTEDLGSFVAVLQIRKKMSQRRVDWFFIQCELTHGDVVTLC